jgi:hypothetical protein
MLELHTGKLVRYLFEFVGELFGSLRADWRLGHLRSAGAALVHISPPSVPPPYPLQPLVPLSAN